MGARLTGRLPNKARIALGVLAVVVVVAFAPHVLSKAFSDFGLLALARYAPATGVEASADLSEARAWLERSLAWDARNASAYRGLGWVGVFESDWDACSTAWRQAGWTQQDLLLLADTALEAGLPERAQGYLRVARDLNGYLDSTIAFREYQALEAVGRESESAAALAAAIGQDAGWVDATDRMNAWLAWARMLAGQGRDRESREAVEVVIGLCSEDDIGSNECWKPYDVLAQILLARGDCAEAAARLEEAIGRFPSEAWLRVRYGQVLFLRTPEDLAGAEEQFAIAANLRSDETIWKAIVEFWSVQQVFDRMADWCARAEASGQGPAVACTCSSQ
jgi:tetratricopeptide (TPR) repeat protein